MALPAEWIEPHPGSGGVRDPRRVARSIGNRRLSPPTIPGPTIPGPTIPGPTIPGLTIPGPTIPGPTIPGPTIPDYLKETYDWAYLRPAAARLLDRTPVVSAILWGNHRRLLNATLAELEPGQRVYQPACVYGDFSAKVASALGPRGRLDVTDVAPLQVKICHRKLSAAATATVKLWDAADRRSELYDAVCCYFLLHEMPDAYKRRVVEALLGAVRPGGKVVFVDYHRPHGAHPLKAIMSLVFDTLEPFAKELWINEIASYSRDAGGFEWSKQTYFWGLYQKTVARRRLGPMAPPDDSNPAPS